MEFQLPTKKLVFSGLVSSTGCELSVWRLGWKKTLVPFFWGCPILTEKTCGKTDPRSRSSWIWPAIDLTSNKMCCRDSRCRHQQLSLECHGRVDDWRSSKVKRRRYFLVNFGSDVLSLFKGNPLSVSIMHYAIVFGREEYLCGMWTWK